MVRTEKTKRSYAGEVGPPATKYNAVNRNREEMQDRLQKVTTYDATTLKPINGGVVAESCTLRTRNASFKIGTWNVRTLYQAGKLDNLLQEMKLMNLIS